MEILFEDKNLIVVVKDKGIASQRGNGNFDNLVDLLSKKCETTVYCVHRLDLQTSGVMVYAKNSKIAGQLSESLKSAEKKYYAKVSGITPSCGTFTDYLYHDKRINKVFVAKKERKGVKEATLDFETIKQNDAFSVVSVKLHTGRTHQIRVQFSSRGFPIVGDGKYGSKINSPLALHCYSLSFEHPITKEKLTFCNDVIDSDLFKI